MGSQHTALKKQDEKIIVNQSNQFCLLVNTEKNEVPRWHSRNLGSLHKAIILGLLV